MRWQAVLKTLGLTAAAGAAGTVAQQVPQMVDPAIGGPLAAMIAALVGLFLRRPQDVAPER